MTSNMAILTLFRRENELITKISRWSGQRNFWPKFFFSWLRYHSTQLLEWVSTLHSTFLKMVITFDQIPNYNRFRKPLFMMN